jgi:hypothetical protein
MTVDWQSALAIALIGFAVGFVTGYGVLAFISYRRRKAARRARRGIGISATARAVCQATEIKEQEKSVGKNESSYQRKFA